MPEPKGQPLLPSLLDRLYDEDPSAPHDVIPLRPQDAVRQVLNRVKKSLHRDLEALLNTRVRNVTWEPHLTNLEGSLLDYGLPDFTHITLAGPEDRRIFCDQIASIIRTHEPRLIKVDVKGIGNDAPVDRTFRFRIHAELNVDPEPEPIRFDSVVTQGTGSIRLEEGRA